jgi:PTH2 family peptidyl-tRNA hydrolase
MSDIRQIIVMRKDLGMRKGKMIAQGAHASMKVIFDQMVKGPEKGKYSFIANDDLCEWIDGLFTKITVSVKSEEDLLAVFEAAVDADLPCALIEDAGKTEFKGPTLTCCAIGPAPKEKLDPITGKLPLL